MDDFSHSGSVSDGLQMLVPQHVRVFGHYAAATQPRLHSHLRLSDAEVSPAAEDSGIAAASTGKIDRLSATDGG